MKRDVRLFFVGACLVWTAAPVLAQNAPVQQIKCRYTYTVVSDSATRNADLNFLRKFAARVESDERGRLMLENNASRLTPLLIVNGQGNALTYTMHLPMNEVAYTPADKKWSYAYSGDTAAFARLPEVKRALADATVARFVGPTASGVHVAAKGGPKTFFDCTFARDGKVLKVRVEGKKVTAFPN